MYFGESAEIEKGLHFFQNLYTYFKFITFDI